MAKKKLFGLLIVAAAALGLLAFALLQNPGTDEDQIRAALDESIVAAKEGRSGSVLDLLSKDFRLNDQQLGPGRQVAQFIRDSHPDVTMAQTDPVVDGDQAVLETPVTIKLGVPLNTTIELPNVTLQFRKERAAKWLIFPGSKWRLVRAISEGLPTSDFMP